MQRSIPPSIHFHVPITISVYLHFHLTSRPPLPLPPQDSEYQAVGATIVPHHKEALKQDIVLKVWGLGSRYGGVDAPPPWRR